MKSAQKLCYGIFMKDFTFSKLHLHCTPTDNPAGNFLLKVNNRSNEWKVKQICSTIVKNIQSLPY